MRWSVSEFHHSSMATEMLNTVALTTEGITISPHLSHSSERRFARGKYSTEA
jgi:hypothetical protein